MYKPVFLLKNQNFYTIKIASAKSTVWLEGDFAEHIKHYFSVVSRQIGLFKIK